MFINSSPHVQVELFPERGGHPVRREVDERDAVGGEPPQEVRKVAALAVGGPGKKWRYKQGCQIQKI